jgi:hypothetical protein
MILECLQSSRWSWKGLSAVVKEGPYVLSFIVCDAGLSVIGASSHVHIADRNTSG